MVRAGKAVRLCLKRIAATRLTASNFRTQEANRREAIDRLVRMIRQAAIERPVRTPTRPSLGSKRRRLAAIAKRGDVNVSKGREAAGQIAPLRISSLGRNETFKKLELNGKLPQ